jgi:hypothetical protein
MFRNDTIIPFLALLISFGLGLMAYLDGQHIAGLAGRTQAELSVGQIGLIAFGIVLFLYGLIGSISAWLEGEELRPGKHLPRLGRTPVVIGVILAVALVVLSGLFVNSVFRALETGKNAPAVQGGLIALSLIIAAVLLAITKKYLVGDETLAEDEHQEFPW